MNEGPSAKNGEGRTSEGPYQGWQGLSGYIKGGRTACSARIPITPPLQALAGLRVVASLLGLSPFEALSSHAITKVGQ